VSSPSLDDENTLQILSLKGFTCRKRDISLKNVYRYYLNR